MIGKAINKIEINSLKLLVFIKIQTKYAPKKLLPTSPINILDGLQLKIKKPIKDPTTKKVGLIMKNIEKEKIIIEEPDKIPSIPSMKLKKFMMPINKIIINSVKGINKYIFKSFIELHKYELKNIYVTVINWIKSLTFLLQPLMSSTKPIILIGMK